MPTLPHQAMLADQLAEAHREAYNAAFEELGLNWTWDAATYAALAAPGPQAVRAYLEREQSHLLRAYEPDFIVNAIEGTKLRCHATIAAHRNGVAPLRTNP